MDLLLPVGLGILLLCSAFFSGSETALLGLNPMRLRWMRDQGYDTTRIESFLQYPARALTTILFGNLLTNMAASAMATTAALSWFGPEGLGIVIIGLSILLLIVGEVTPKIIAVHRPETVALLATPILQGFALCITPVRVVLVAISETLVRWIQGPRHKEEAIVTEEDVRTLVEIGHEEGAMNRLERRMIHSVLRYTDIQVSSIMVPRVDMVAASAALSQHRFRQLLLKSCHSKIPVYRDSIDNIIGIVYAKDVLLNPQKSYMDQMVPPFFVPETARLHQVFQQLRDQQRRLALIVDEYGGTVGMVTMEDLVEEVFGEIYDEFERPDYAVRQIRAKTYRVRGNTPVRELNDALNLDMPEEDYSTLAGLILERLERLPHSGESLEIEGVQIRVEKVADRRILTLTMTVP